MEILGKEMTKHRPQIDKLSDHLMAQELAFGLRKRQRAAEAKSVFTKAISWLGSGPINLIEAFKPV